VALNDGLAGAQSRTGKQDKRLWRMNPMAYVSLGIWLTAVINLWGCATSANLQSNMNSWIGKPISQCIQQNGPASTVSDDGKGGRVYTWISGGGGGVVTNTGFGQQLYIPQAQSSYSFYADAGGTIYHWMTR
jgi:hypothetical protein